MLHREITVDVPYHGFTFEFWGEWLPYQKATMWEPEEGGYFGNYRIKLFDKPVDDILSDRAVNDIIGYAENEYMERYGR